MKKARGKANLCSRGHTFYKSSERPVCPICWPGYDRKRGQNDFPDLLATPALRALLHAKITTMAQLSKRTKTELLELHGMGPKAIGQLKAALLTRGLAFAKK